MTVIAWDGTTLAADKRTSFGTSIATSTKIYKINGMLVGYAGDAAKGRSCFQWIRDGMIKADYPAPQKANPGSLLVITAEGKIHYYCETADPLHIEDKFFSIGSGSEYADAALYLGKTAVEAVEVAIALDSACGNGIDTLTLENKNEN